MQAQLVILQHGSNSFEDTIHLLSREKGYVQRCMKNGIERNAQLVSSLNEMAKQMKDKKSSQSATVKYEKLETKYEKSYAVRGLAAQNGGCNSRNGERG